MIRNATTPKPRKCRKCRECRQPFVPLRAMQPVCERFECKVAYASKVAARSAAKRQAAERKVLRVRKEAAKTTTRLKAEAQAAINAYRRYQDLAAGYNCICCDKPFEPNKPGGSVDAGHFLSRGSHPNLAFDERNINAQRKSCNRPGGTTSASFRLGMIRRYGIAVVEELEADTAPRRYRADDYRVIRDLYRAKLKDLKEGMK